MYKHHIQNIIIGFNRKLSEPLLEKINLHNCLLEAYKDEERIDGKNEIQQQWYRRIYVSAFAIYQASVVNPTKEANFFNCFKHTKFYQLKADILEWINTIKKIENILTKVNSRYHDNYKIEFIATCKIPPQFLDAYKATVDNDPMVVKTNSLPKKCYKN